jgi:uncharacterized protein YjcR
VNEVRAPNYELALLDYQSGMKYKDIAEKHGVTINTVKSWKTRYKWSKDKKKGVHTKSEKVCTQKGGQSGNRNAVGHGAPSMNKNAVKHGLFSKYLPEETLAIVEELHENALDPVDILYDNILMHQAAIIRAQRIMYVKNQADLTKELKKVKTSTSGMNGKNKSSELEYELQFAWDKQASYLQAQSRAMQTVNTMIKQFKELTAPDDERRLRLELMEVELEKRRKEAESFGGGGNAVDDWIDVVTGEDEGDDVD